MAPDPGDGTYTVHCAVKRLIPDAAHVEVLQDAAVRVNRATARATELLNLYVRDRLEHHGGTGLESIFKQNWLLEAYYAVTTSRANAKVNPAIAAVAAQYMQGAEKPDRTGLTQCLTYECINLAAVGSTNVWFHFRKRMLKHVQTAHALDDAAYKQLSKDQKRQRRLALLQAADDLCRPLAEDFRSPAELHDWIGTEHQRLGIDAAVGTWDGKPLLYHLKAHPERFLKAVYLMSKDRVAAERGAFALFPLRQTLIPRHIRVDKKVLDHLLGLKMLHKQKKERCAATGRTPGSGRAAKRDRDDPTLIAEKQEVFGAVFDLRGAKVRRRHHFDYSFTTDGVSAHLLMRNPKKATKQGKRKRDGEAEVLPTEIPTRGRWSIDALKHASRNRLDDLHVVGIDPGKRELIHAVDADADARSTPSVRYTLAERRRDLRTRQREAEVRHTKPSVAAAAERELSLHNSKAPSLEGFAAYVQRRHELLVQVPEWEAFYAEVDHRHGRHKSFLKTQASEAKLYKKLQGMHDKNDKRQLVLAYGAWGLTAGPQMCNKGNPPAIGAGLMKKLDRRFVVVPTPEHFTSKTCVACGGLCGAHPTLRTKKDKEIRGLRVCQHEGCGLYQNRDRTGAINIGRQLRRLLRGDGPLHSMTDEELEFQRLNVCLACD